MGMYPSSSGRGSRIRPGALVIALAAASVVVGYAATDPPRAASKDKAPQEQKGPKRAPRKLRKQALEHRAILAKVAADPDFSSMDPLKQERLLNKTLKDDPGFLEVSVADAAGKENVRMGRDLGPAPELRDMSKKPPFLAAIHGKDFLEASKAPKLFDVAVPIPGAGKPKGAIIAVVETGREGE